MCIAILVMLVAVAQPLLASDEITYQDEEEAFAADVDIQVNETGLPREVIEARWRFQESSAEYGETLFERFPGQISRLWASESPATTLNVQFVGAIPEEVSAEITGLDFAVVLMADGEISMDEHFRRSTLAAEALSAAGFRNYSTYFDMLTGMLTIELRLWTDANHPTLPEIVQIVQDWVRANAAGDGQTPLSERAVEVHESDVELILIPPNRPAAMLGAPPLATYDLGNHGMFHFIPGTEGQLRVTDSCVWLTMGNHRRDSLILWPEPTYWNVRTQTIEFYSPRKSGTRYLLRPDAHVRLDGPLTRDIDTLPLIIPPDPTCDATHYVIVDGVQLVTGGTPRETSH